MSTRCNIGLYYENDVNPGCLLYHHYDGYPEFMVNKLTRFLNKTIKILSERGVSYWFDPERVGALLVMLSVNNYTDPEMPTKEDVPYFQPCTEKHGDIDYYYEVRLYSDLTFKISYEEM